jgi:exonuclease III
MCFNHVFLSKHFVNLAVWKINGIKSKVHNKFDDKSFVDCIQSCDVIGLVETHLIESLPSPSKDFNIHHFYRTQNSRAKRNFGGISILVRKSS